jgi:hypothetical protein
MTRSSVTNLDLLSTGGVASWQEAFNQTLRLLMREQNLPTVDNFIKKAQAIYPKFLSEKPRGEVRRELTAYLERVYDVRSKRQSANFDRTTVSLSHRGSKMHAVALRHRLTRFLREQHASCKDVEISVESAWPASIQYVPAISKPHHIRIVLGHRWMPGKIIELDGRPDLIPVMVKRSTSWMIGVDCIAVHKMMSEKHLFRLDKNVPTVVHVRLLRQGNHFKIMHEQVVQSLEEARPLVAKTKREAGLT